MSLVSRRNFLVGLGAVVAAPAIIRASSLDMMSGKRLLMGDENIFVDPGINAIVRLHTETIWNGSDGSIDRPFRTIEAAFDHIHTKLDTNGKRVDVHLASGEYKPEGILDLPERGSLVVDSTSFVLLRDCELRRQRIMDDDSGPIIWVRHGSTLEMTGAVING